jgi:uncharacterized GH25 family protein
MIGTISEPTMRLLLVLLFAWPAAAHGHYHMLLPERHSVKEGEAVVVTYQFGHPFESQLFDTEKPAKATVYAPDGKATDVLPQLEQGTLTGAEGKKVAVYRFTFRPEGRGDFTLVFESPPVWMADEKHFVRDVTRVVVHVVSQKGWDARHAGDEDFALVPMTRPYGLRPGTVFQARAGTAEASGPHAAELERYNVAPPRTLPPDELITLALKTDDRGVATCTLPEPGWWALTVTGTLGPKGKPPMMEKDGTKYPVVRRVTLWVFVDELAVRKDLPPG